MVPMLEITYRKGRPLAAYLRLGSARGRVAATRELAPNLIGDFDEGGRLRGLEILAFDANTLAKINEVLAAHGAPSVPEHELSPLRAA